MKIITLYQILTFWLLAWILYLRFDWLSAFVVAAIGVLTIYQIVRERMES